MEKQIASAVIAGLILLVLREIIFNRPDDPKREPGMMV